MSFERWTAGRTGSWHHASFHGQQVWSGVSWLYSFGFHLHLEDWEGWRVAAKPRFHGDRIWSSSRRLIQIVSSSAALPVCNVWIDLLRFWTRQAAVNWCNMIITFCKKCKQHDLYYSTFHYLHNVSDKPQAECSHPVHSLLLDRLSNMTLYNYHITIYSNYHHHVWHWHVSCLTYAWWYMLMILRSSCNLQIPKTKAQPGPTALKNSPALSHNGNFHGLTRLRPIILKYILPVTASN